VMSNDSVINRKLLVKFAARVAQGKISVVTSSSCEMFNITLGVLIAYEQLFSVTGQFYAQNIFGQASDLFVLGDYDAAINKLNLLRC
ncbi:hypothetical protein, partial [uncultured Pseudoalteromonas sp.]|uniref:hypothetical protein n=1 Tax=uncultured Pseudoalteromonas sp. TaxID=114053 RepID=UPI0030F59A1D